LNVLINSNKFIEYSKIEKIIGYKNKRTVTDILKNEKYDFLLDNDYKIIKQKSTGGRPMNEIMMTIDTIKTIILLSPTKKGHEFRKYYIEMEKLFRKFIDNEIKNKITNPIPELNKYDFDVTEHTDKEVLYLICVKDNVYKFGITYNIGRRLSTHKKILNYDYEIKCWDCKNRTVSKGVEDSIKKYCKLNKLFKIYEGTTEIVETSDIKNFINIIDKNVDIGIKNYRKFIAGEKHIMELELLEKKIELIKLAKDSGKINISINLSENNIEDVISKDLDEIKRKIEDECNDEIIKNKNGLDKEDPINELVNDKTFCKRCRQFKENGLFKDNNKIFKQCSNCRLEQLEVDKRRDVKILKETSENGTFHCKKCRKNKKPIDFEYNTKTSDYYKNCTECKNKDKQKRRENYLKNRDKKLANKKEYYNKNKQVIRDKQKEYYDKNREEIIDHKRQFNIKKR
jgi:phage anti-repressor protein